MEYDPHDFGVEVAYYECGGLIAEDRVDVLNTYPVTEGLKVANSKIPCSDEPTLMPIERIVSKSVSCWASCIMSRRIITAVPL
ncbi:hypothetical protein EVAR_89433_1 [Eumeta japonica]|uniref:Uncharacterized protein n=1 Tax=Eumeta variegata TaxID=151549 RepID=A0A4C1Z4U0_EUMVA|nr:hypothetical protein EVAR_89433_1 [Eumeta japonica]